MVVRSRATRRQLSGAATSATSPEQGRRASLSSVGEEQDGNRGEEKMGIGISRRFLAVSIE
jgi:hypothetical protein